MKSDLKKRKAVLDRELYSVEKLERKLRDSALKAKDPSWKIELESKIPDKIHKGLESAFCKGFTAVFEQGRGLIEKSYSKDNIQAEHLIRDFAVQVKGGRREFRQIHKCAGQIELRNLAVTSLEGIGLGALGIGMPDIVLFLSTLLKGIYETALSYGFDYVSNREKLLILKMMEASLSKSTAWIELNTQIDEMFGEADRAVSDEELMEQLKSCSSVFAMDMLLLKFVQGLPVVGIIGGAANPVYYHKVMKYVSLKFKKHYLINQSIKIEKINRA